MNERGNSSKITASQVLNLRPLRRIFIPTRNHPAPYANDAHYPPSRWTRKSNQNINLSNHSVLFKSVALERRHVLRIKILGPPIILRSQHSQHSALCKPEWRYLISITLEYSWPLIGGVSSDTLRAKDLPVLLKPMDIYYLPSPFARGVGVKAILRIWNGGTACGWTRGEDSMSVGMIGME